MQRVAIYIRVSTEEQAKEGFSISAQRQRLMSYAQSMDWDIYDLFIDEGYSGAKSDRPELNRLRNDMTTRSFDLVLVWKVDRFFRSVYYLSEILHQMEQSNIGFVSMTESFNTSSPSGKAMLQMLAIFAEFERETIRERIIENLAERARQGFHHGPVPYGYERDAKKNLIIVPDQAEVVKRCFDLRSKGKSYNAITKDIQKKYPEQLHSNDTNTVFHFVVQMLQNPTYTGKVKHRDEVLPGTHEAIITEELFQLVNSRSGSRHKAHSYIFQGIIYCGSCGSRMTSKMRKHQKYGYRKVYLCPNTAAKYKPDMQHTCDGRSIDENVILKQLVEYLDNYGLELHSETSTEREDNLEVEAKSIDKKINDLKKRKTRYFNLFEEADEDFVEAAKDRIKEISTAIRELELQKEELLSAQQQSASTKTIDMDEIKEALLEIKILVEKADHDKLSEMFRLMFERIVIHRTDVKPAKGRSSSVIEPIWVQDI